MARLAHVLDSAAKNLDASLVSEPEERNSAPTEANAATVNTERSDTKNSEPMSSNDTGAPVHSEPASGKPNARTQVVGGGRKGGGGLAMACRCVPTLSTRVHLGKRALELGDPADVCHAGAEASAGVPPMRGVYELKRHLASHRSSAT